MYNKENIFAKIINKEMAADIIDETQHSIVIKDKYPTSKTHNLVLCKGEYEHLKDFLNHASTEEKADFFNAIALQLNNLNNANVVFNIGKKAHQEVMHLHAHIMSDEDAN